MKKIAFLFLLILALSIPGYAVYARTDSKASHELQALYTGPDGEAYYHEVTVHLVDSLAFDGASGTLSFVYPELAGGNRMTLRIDSPHSSGGQETLFQADSADALWEPGSTCQTGISLTASQAVQMSAILSDAHGNLLSRVHLSLDGRGTISLVEAENNFITEF